MIKILLNTTDDGEVIYTTDCLDFSNNAMTFTDILGGVREIRGTQIAQISHVQMNTSVLQWIKRNS